MTDYTKEAEELYPYKKYENLRKGIIYSTIIDSYREAHIAARQQSAAEIDRLRGEVRKLREGLEEMISTIERNAVDNRATIENVKLWAKSWREELLTETEG